VTSPLGSPPDRKAWRPVDAAIVLAWWFAGGILATLVVAPDAQLTTLETFGVVVPVQSFAVFAAVAFLARRRTDWREALAARIAWDDWVGVLIGIGLEIGLAVVLFAIVQGLNRSVPEQQVVDLAAGSVGPAEWSLMIVSLLVIGPLAEEVMFRGVLLRSLFARYGTVAAVWWSAAAFAALHLLDPNAIFVAPLLLILGVVMGYQALATGRLGRSYTIHLGFNLVTVVALIATR
jgi:membrane protease YdiL (CAAX protease family)